MKMDTVCAVHEHDSSVPVELHHVWPLGLGGPNNPTNRIQVCTNGHYEIHAFMDYLNRYDGRPPWEIAREFGPRVRAFALQGYNDWKGANNGIQYN